MLRNRFANNLQTFRSIFCYETEVLPRELEKILVAQYLKQGAEAFEARALGRPIRDGNHDACGANAINDALDSGFEALASNPHISKSSTKTPQCWIVTLAITLSERSQSLPITNFRGPRNRPRFVHAGDNHPLPHIEHYPLESP